jgi:uncharacterized protein YndB with AHSA1/START domain
MGHVKETTIIEVPPERVWDLLTDYGALPNGRRTSSR